MHVPHPDYYQQESRRRPPRERVEWLSVFLETSPEFRFVDCVTVPGNTCSDAKDGKISIRLPNEEENDKIASRLNVADQIAPGFERTVFVFLAM